jgi:hypothetical protein
MTNHQLNNKCQLTTTEIQYNHVQPSMQTLDIFITIVLHDILTSNMLVINIHMYISQHVSAIVSHHQVKIYELFKILQLNATNY